MKEAIRDRIERAIQKKVFPGCVVAVASRNPDVRGKVYTFGTRRYGDTEHVHIETRYDIASLTKVFTALLILRLIDDKALSLNTRVTEHIPEFGEGRWKERVSIQHLLTYTIDLEIPPLSFLVRSACGANEIIEKILRAPLKVPPGIDVCYANPTAILLSMLASRASGYDFDSQLYAHVLNPIGMWNTRFYPRINTIMDDIAPTTYCPWRTAELLGIPHDESSYVFASSGKNQGHAGLFSTGADMLFFLKMFLCYGERSEGRCVGKSLLDKMQKKHSPKGSARKTGLGVMLGEKRYMGRGNLSKRFGMTGHTGCSLVIDQKLGKCVVILSNRTFPKNPKNSRAINSVRRDIADIIFES
jgi:serine-type D-Ala-D-Ala carboxypeptidase